MSFTDYEEGIAFDTDDPDFDNNNCRNINIFPSLPHDVRFNTWDKENSCKLYVGESRPCVVPADLPKMAIGIPIGGRMSVASVQSVGLVNRSQSYSSVSSLEEHLPPTYLSPETTVLSIEELRLQLNSCFTCGVSWQEEHVSLDCSECGGYSLARPCPLCEGRCCSLWKRDLTMSHACGKARWQGTCALSSEPQLKLLLQPLPSDEESRLCSRIEKLTATS